MIKRSDITEESVWIWTCPNCKETMEEDNDMYNEEEATCCKCDITHEILEKD